MVRSMTIEDYEAVYELWMQIKGFAMRSVDDSKDGVERFLRRNPKTSVVAVEDGKVVGAILCGVLADAVRDDFSPVWFLIVPQILIAVLANFTACVRILHVYKAIREKEKLN